MSIQEIKIALANLLAFLNKKIAIEIRIKKTKLKIKQINPPVQYN